MPTITTLVTFSVTAKHIASGIPRNACNCAVGLAISEQLPSGYKFDGLATGYILIYKDHKSHHVDTPVEVAQFINAFDGNIDSFLHPIKPFSFTLGLP